jgi:phytoene dehydrogenase-like protein
MIIIGAGLAGLSTGCYAQMNGYCTQIFEMHSKPGGLCTVWKRKGYTIGTPGWVMGSKPANNDYYRLMNMRVSKTLPGLDSFYLVGTWVNNGSLPGAVTSGRHVAQVICHEDKRPFVTTVP